MGLLGSREQHCSCHCEVLRAPQDEVLNKCLFKITIGLQASLFHSLTAVHFAMQGLTVYRSVIVSNWLEKRSLSSKVICTWGRMS